MSKFDLFIKILITVLVMGVIAGFFGIVYTEHKAKVAQQQYNEQFLYKLQDDPILKLTNARILETRKADLIYLNKGFGSSLEQIYLPITILIVEDFETDNKMKIVYIGECNYKQGSYISIDIRKRTELDATQIWYLYYNKEIWYDDTITSPSTTFNNLIGYFINR